MFHNYIIIKVNNGYLAIDELIVENKLSKLFSKKDYNKINY